MTDSMPLTPTELRLLSLPIVGVPTCWWLERKAKRMGIKPPLQLLVATHINEHSSQEAFVLPEKQDENNLEP